MEDMDKEASQQVEEDQKAWTRDAHKQGGEDRDKTWLDGPVASVKGKLSDDLAPMDRGNGEEQVRSRSMYQ